MRADANTPWMLRPDGLDVRVQVTLPGRRDAPDGVERLADGRAVLCARVLAAPENGAAKTAVDDPAHAVPRRTTRCPREAAALVAGRASRVKTLRIAAGGAVLAAALTMAIAPQVQGRKRGDEA